MRLRRSLTTATIVLSVLAIIALAVFVSFALQNPLFSGSVSKEVRFATEAPYTTSAGTSGIVQLPGVISGLEPHTTVNLTLQISPQPDEYLRIETSFAHLRVYMNDDLVRELGQAGSYPPFMIDPPTSTTIVPLPNTSELVNIRLEYLSPLQRDTLLVPAMYAGNEMALLVQEFSEDGPYFAFALILLFLGIAFVVAYFSTLRMLPNALTFLWLGLLTLSASIWALGENALTPYFIPYPTVLYVFSYLGLFCLAIPFLQLGLLILNPKNRMPFVAMLGLQYVSLAIAFVLQFTSVMDFSKTMYWFQIIVPLGYLMFACCLLWEYFKYRNPAAGQFAPTIVLMALSSLFLLIDYWLQLSDSLSAVISVVVLTIVVSLAIVSGQFVRRVVATTAEKERMEHVMTVATRRLELQRAQFQKMAENEQALKAQRHDLRHQLAAIRAMGTDQNKLESYIDGLIANIPTGRELIFCDNFAVNAVVVHYYALAEQDGIDISMTLDVPSDIDSSLESDLCIIVGNLLENAIEACNRMQQGARFILMSSRLQYGVLTLVVDNSFEGRLYFRGGDLLSQKRQGKGLGVASTKAVAQKNGGDSHYEFADGVFKTSVYLKLNSGTN